MKVLVVLEDLADIFLGFPEVLEKIPGCYQRSVGRFLGP